MKYRLKAKPEVVLDLVATQAVFVDDTGVEVVHQWDDVEEVPEEGQGDG